MTAQGTSEVIVAPQSRNSPCPCGSGHRYKDCHGSLRGSVTGQALPASTPRSAYRAPPREWGHLSEEVQNRLGERMVRALALQTSGSIDEAAREYRAVIVAAPETHDALHMLGIIELGRRNVEEAERLISGALALRPPYAAIQHNLQLVHDAHVALARAQPEQLAERALPILVELALTARPAERAAEWSSTPHRAAKVHLIGRLHGDDDSWLLRRLAQLVDMKDITLWSVDGDGTETVDARRVHRVDAATGWLPHGGTHIFVGVDFDCASWIDRAVAECVVLFCLPTAPTRYLDQLRALAHDGARPLQLVFPSRAAADRFGNNHAVMMPPLDRDAVAIDEDRAIEMQAPFTIGIVGQNQQFIADPIDLELVKSLESIAGGLHIYDPGRFRYALGASRTARFFERKNGSLERFLARLGCFVHRTQAWWNDTLGRELYGAMMHGVPVLCPVDSIHAERIEHGVDGFLYASCAEAQQQIADLRNAPELAHKIGRAGRDKVRALLAPDAQARHCRDLVVGTAAMTRGSSERMRTLA